MAFRARQSRPQPLTEAQLRWELGARRRLLEAAAEFDDSNGLRTALRILDAHPVPLRVASALLGVGQAACIAAAANYGTGTPLVVRAKTAGCWAR